MNEPINNGGGFPRGLTIGIVLVFLTMALGTCLLVFFLFNLPVIFPPPGRQETTLGMVTVTPPRFPDEAPTRVPPSATAVKAPSPTPDLTRTPTRLAVQAPVSGRIVFVTERNGFNSIYVMNSDGTGQRLLVPHSGNYYDYAPAVSPDGTRVAFSSNREKPGTDNLYVMNMDGSGLVRITSTPNSKNASASWFPDGGRLAFVSNRTGRWQVYTMNSDGGNVRQIISSNEDTLNVQVSPNGALVAYTCGKEICVANSDGSNPRVLLRNGSPKDHLAWAPDSSQLAFTQANPNSSKTGIHVVDMAANNRQVIGNGGWAWWSPDGNRLVFSSDMEGVANLYYYELPTGQISRLTSTAAADITPVWIR